MKIRHSSLFNMDSIAPLGSKTWAEEGRKTLQDAVNGAVDGSVRLTDAIRYFWKHEGWKVLEDSDGEPFKTMRMFARAERPHGLHMTMDMYKAFVEDMGKTVEEAFEQATEDIKRPRGRRSKDKSLSDNDLSQGTTSDYLARRIARQRPDIAERAKAGEFETVKEAARAAGLIKEKTPLEVTQQTWRKADADERQRITQWILEQP